MGRNMKKKTLRAIMRESLRIYFAPVVGAYRAIKKEIHINKT
jgi:hypothetical protein